MGKPSHHRCHRAAAALLQLLLLSGRHVVTASRAHTARCRVSALAAPGTHNCGGGDAEGTCMDEVRATVNEVGFWYATLGAEATAAILDGDAFDLRGDALCSERPLPAEVTVSPRINATSPVDGSYAHVEIKIGPSVAGGRDKFYVCFRGRAVFPPCLAALTAPRMSNTLRGLISFAALAEWVVRRSELVKALDEASALVYATLEVALILVSVLFLISLLRALWALARLPPGGGVTADLRAVEVRGPAGILVSAAVRVLAFVAAVANLMGIGLPLIMKTVHPCLLAAIYLWPCTLGLYAVSRASLLVCSVQRYHAGLLLGKVVLAGRAKAKHEAVVVAGVMLFFACYFAAMACTQSASGVLAGCTLAASPILSIVAALVALRGQEVEQSKQLVKMSLRDVAALDLAGLGAGADTDALAALSGRKMVEVSEAAFCDTWRSSADPLPVLAGSSEGSLLAEGREFGFRDYAWHAECIYRVTGSRAAFFNVPAMLLCAALLILTSMQWFLRCATVWPSLDRVEVGRGLLVPDFQPERRFYTLYDDASALDVQLLHAMERATTDKVSIRVSRGAYRNSTLSGDLAVINLRNVRVPWEVQILAQGSWGRAKEYTLQLLPMSTIVRSVSLRAKGWVRCIDWLTADKQQQTVTLLGGVTSLDVELTMEEFVFSRPEGHETRSHSSGEIFTQFAALNTSLESCSEWCDDHPLCRVAWEGIGGCFFGMVPKGDSSCGSHRTRSTDAAGLSTGPYHKFLHRRVRRTFVELCVLGEAGGRSCKTVQRHEIGRVQMGSIRFGHTSATLTLRVQRVTKEGRHLQLASQSFLLLRRPPPVQQALVVAEGVYVDAAVQLAKQFMHITIRDMDFSAAPDPFRIIVVPLAEDPSFYEVMSVGRFENEDWECGQSSLSLAKACAANPGFRHLTICGGPTYSQACTIRVPKWDPSGVWRLYLRPRHASSRSQGLTISVQVALAGDQTPAELAMGKNCAVDFGKPPEVAMGWISPGMFRLASGFCVRNITLKAYAVSTFSPLQFFLMGVYMYPSEAVEYFEDALRHGILSEEQVDKDAELTPTLLGVSIKIPIRTISHELAIWAPWVPAAPFELYLNLAALIQDGRPRAAKIACVHSELTPRGASQALLTVVAREIHRSRVKTRAMIASLARCFKQKNITLGVPTEHQSPWLAAIRLSRVDIFVFLEQSRLTPAVGTIARRGRVVSYAVRSVESLAVAYGCAGCVFSLRSLNLAAMGLTERDLPGMVTAMGALRGVRSLDVSWNRLGLRGVGQLLDARRAEQKPRLRRLRVGHNAEETVAVGKSAWAPPQVDRGHVKVSRYQFLSGMPGLEELDLSGSGVGPSGAPELGLVLAGMPHLETLNLSSNDLGDEGVAALAASLGSLRALRSLDLSGNGVGAAGLRALNVTALSSLEFLYMSENSLGEDNCSALGDVLAHMARLQHLSIGGNRIGVAGAVKVEAALSSLARLRMLDISQNPITDVGLKALRIDRLSSLTALDLSGTGLGVRGSTALAAALPALSLLQTLGLDSNGFGAAEIAAIAPALSSAARLTSLALGANSIGTNMGGVAELARALRGLPPLRHLDLRENHLRATDLGVLCGPLHGMAHLETLRIQGNDFGDDTIHVWRCLAGLTRVRVLDLSSNHLFAVRASPWRGEVEVALQGMRNLEHLVLYGNRFPPEDLPGVMEHIMHLLEREAVSLKLLQLRGVVPVVGDLLTEGDLRKFQSMYPWILLA